MTILIKGVQILSNGKRLADKSDIFVSGDKISAIGNFPAKIADYVIDGQSCYVSPGFIDINTDSDHYLSIFSQPLQEDFIRQGVTTIIGGQCGSSLAPLLYGRLDSIRKWTDIAKVNVGWHELKELLSLLEKKPLGVNFGTLIGHSTIRRDIIGEEIRSLTTKELDVFEHVLSTAIDQGGFGMSTGLGYAHSLSTPSDELLHLATVVKNKNGIYATHLRSNTDGLTDAINETIILNKKTGVKTIISHFLPIEGQEKAYQIALEELGNLSPEMDLYFDLSPFSVSILPLYVLLPSWAKEGNIREMRKKLKDGWFRSKILKEMGSVDPDKIIISRAENNDLLVGRSLSDCVQIYETKTPQEALIKIMASTELRASVFYENINTERLLEAIGHPRCLIASNAASLSKTSEVILKPERARRTFPKFLSMVEEKRIMPIEKAVQRITEKPAQLFNIEKRGEIKEGFFADLTGFINGEIKFTIVNGHLAFENYELNPHPHGKILRHRLP
jgi:N-acyl-D-amino-acid deacylase